MLFNGFKDLFLKKKKTTITKVLYSTTMISKRYKQRNVNDLQKFDVKLINFILLLGCCNNCKSMHKHD